ncbi:MAG: DUF3108 domain-containing protein [Pseudomonadota bacterium]
MQRHADLRHRLHAGILLLWAALCGTPAAAEETAGLRPFHATYAASLNGMPLGFAVTLELTGMGANQWNLALAASSAMVKYREQSQFRWQDCASIPQRYRYDFSGFGISRKLWLDFDHDKRRANGESRKGPLTYDFPADATDELSLTFAARCQFARGASEAQFNVATTNGMKHYTYRYEKREEVDTPWGKIETMRIERVRKAGDKRRSTLWVAPSLGYLMVKMEHVEKLGVRGSISLKKLEMADAAAPPALTKAGAP